MSVVRPSLQDVVKSSRNKGLDGRQNSLRFSPPSVSLGKSHAGRDNILDSLELLLNLDFSMTPGSAHPCSDFPIGPVLEHSAFGGVSFLVRIHFYCSIFLIIAFFLWLI